MTDVKYKRGSSATMPAIEDGSILLTKDTKKLYADIGTERFLLNESADIPIATSTKTGGVKPVTKTSDMTQNVGVDSNGKLWTVPGSGGSTDIPIATSTTVGGVKPMEKQNYMTAPVGIDTDGQLWCPSEKYTLPIATSTTLGGVKPTIKTNDMVQEIGVDSNGKLWGAKGYNISYGTTLPTSGSEGDIFIQI